MTDPLDLDDETLMRAGCDLARALAAEQQALLSRLPQPVVDWLAEGNDEGKRRRELFWAVLARDWATVRPRLRSLRS